MNDIDEVSEFLEHFGVKGMQWGIRKQAHRDRLTRVAEKRATAQDKRLMYRQYGTVSPHHAKIIGKRLDRRQERHDKTVKFIKGHGKEIGIAAGIAAGAAAAGILLKRHQNIAVNNLKMKHETFITAKKLLDEKMTKRMDQLKGLSRKTPSGHPSHEGAMNEIKNLKSFYDTQLKKMTERHNISPELFDRMRARPAI